MPIVRRRPSLTIGRHVIATLALSLAGGLLPMGTVTSAPLTVAASTSDQTPGRAARADGISSATVAPAATAPSGAIQPTVQYEEALAHARDRTSFRAGGRVNVPFQPRSGDTWSVGGGSPRALPAGRIAGATMRASTTDGPAIAPLPVDQPSVRPSRIGGADGATWDASNGPAVVTPAAAVDPGALRHEVFGFLPYWELTDSSLRYDWSTLSTIAYFGVGADSTGDLDKTNADGSPTVGWSGWTSAAMTSVINTAHAQHTRVVLTVQSFAWTSTGLQRQRALLGSAAARSRLASQIARAVRDRGADGVNLDFEPIASGSADQFTALVRSVRAALDATAHGYQLTFDATGWIGNYPIEAATARGGADAIFIMGYDYRAASSATVGSIAPTGGPTYDVRDTLISYLGRVPASKLILGVPYYGRAWSTATNLLDAKNISGTKYGASTSVTYATARQFLVANGRRYDAAEGVAWTVYKRQNCTTAYGCVTPWRQLYVDDAAALSAKYALVNSYGLRGAGIWALGYDGTRPELQQALRDSFIVDTVPPVITGGAISTGVISPNGDGIADVTTARLAVTGLVTWGYTVRPLTGSTPGASVRTGGQPGRTPSFAWDGRDQAGHAVPDGRYLITLWAADVSNNRAQRSFTVVVDTRPPAVRPSVSLGFLSPDGDRHNDSLPLAWTADEALTGTVRVRSAAGVTVRGWVVTGKRAWATTWNGRTASGRTVPDGRYTFRVDGRDGAGNRIVVDRTILVDGTIRSVRWSRPSFAPRSHQTSRVRISLRRTALVSVTVYRGSIPVRTVWTNRRSAAGVLAWTWDGRNDAKGLVGAGTYRIVVTATSAIGTTHFSTSVTVRTQ